MRDVVLVAIGASSILTALWIVGSVQRRKAEQTLLRKRRNLSRHEFVANMCSDADRDVAEWLWEELDVYYKPRLTPHPDDDLHHDLPIDPDEPTDWLAHFCRQHGLRMEHFSDWPARQPITVRNFGRWLTVERNRLTAGN